MPHCELKWEMSVKMKVNHVERIRLPKLLLTLVVLCTALIITSCGPTSLGIPPEVPTEGAYLYPPAQEAEPGQELSVNVEVLSTGAIITGGEIHLTFDPTALNVVDVETGDLLGVDAVVGLSDIDNGAGMVRIALARKGISSDPTSSGVLSVIKLKVLETANPGPYQLNLREVLLTDDEFNFLPDVISHGASINVKGEVAATYALRVEAAPSEGGYVEPESGVYESGERLKLKAEPAEGWKFVRWGRDLSSSSDEAELVMDDNKWVVAHFSPAEAVAEMCYLKVTEDPSEGGYVRHTAGGGEGEFRFESDEVVQFMAVPEEGYEFDGWSGDVSGENPSVRLVMDGNKRVVAHFSRAVAEQYSLSASVDPSGAGSVSPESGTYDSDTVVTLTATPGRGYEFDYWSGDVSGRDLSVRLVMDSNKRVVAHFSRAVAEQYSLSASVDPSGAGSVSPESGTYDSDTVVTLTATPSRGYQFDYWSGAVSGRDPSVRLVMDGNKRVVAHFSRAVAEQYSLSASVDPSGAGSVSPESGTYDSDTVVTLTATPGRGYEFDYWSGDVSGRDLSVRLVMDSNKRVVAHFSRAVAEQYSLSASVEPSGGGSVSPESGTYDSGTVVTLTATPTRGYQFDYWSGDASGRDPSVRLVMDGNKRVVAHFSRAVAEQYSLSASVEPSGGGSVSPESGTYDSGTVVTLTATPGRGYEFDYWSGDVSGRDPSVRLVMDGNKRVVAHFSRSR